MPLTNARRCAGCHRPFHDAPVFLQDTPYCCASCAGGGLCTCFVEADMAADGVDGLGLPFARPSRALTAAGEPAGKH
jgi:hypothetical protein